MCVVSMIHDYYEPKIPDWDKILPYIPPIDTGTPTTTSHEWARAVADLRTLIDEFRRALEAARTVDRLTGQPDCVDPEKAKPEERVARLEAELEKHRGGACY